MKQGRGIALYEDLNKGDIFSLNGLKPEQLAKMIASKYGVNPTDFVTGKGGTIVYNPKRQTNPKPPTTSPSGFGTQGNEDKRNLMRATPSWMYEKYQEMNDRLFGGKLGDCKMEIFTSGKGSQGGTLGWFCTDGGNNKLMIQRSNRKMYALDYAGNKEYVDYKNFVRLCHPTIKLNGNYSGTEHSLLSTLVHEMCHYYTYMYGWAPTQAHGREFRDIAYIVASRSNGDFTVERLATAEEMKGYELDDEFKQIEQKRVENRKSKVTVVVVYEKNGDIELTNASSQQLVDFIIEYHKKRNDAQYILTSNDANLVEVVFKNGYKQAQRAYRYWTINNEKELLDALNNKQEYDINEISFL
ncbi:MAG: SprT-like domain-containing protein [Bacteroidales bacterium]|nr:SprT-like domain-containing protein [Bacteroidales bacterium]